MLRVIGPLGDPSLPEGADRLRESMSLLAFVEARLAAPAEGRILKPVEHEQRPLDLSDLLEGDSKLVLPLVGGELSQHGARARRGLH